DQNVRNNATEVQSIDRAEHTARAVYRVDPHSSGLELQHNPQPDGQINRLKFAFPVLFDMLSPLVKPEVKLFDRLGRTGDRSDELIRNFDHFMNFDQPNLSKARLLRFSEDLATFWPGTVHMKNEQAVYFFSPRDVLSVTPNLDKSSRRVQIDQSTLFSNILVPLVSRTCVSNQVAIESSSSIIGTSASLCVTKQSISSLSLQIEFISSEPVECSFLRVLQVVSEPLFRFQVAMDSEEERNRPGNSHAGLSNLQMRALNDSMSNLLNTGLEAIHQRLDELQGRPTQSRTRTRRDHPRRNSRSDLEIREETSGTTQLRFSPSIGPNIPLGPCIVLTRTRPVWSFSITHDQMAKSTVLKFAFPVLFDMLSPLVKPEVKLFDRLGRTGDRSDELIRHFDQFMNFDQPNLSKARLLRLSEDLATFWPGTVHESHPSVHEERTGRVLLLTAGRAISYTEPGQE
ncbi:hypothetical protein IGI04_035887, partial [Brassica rapa subsp. trilocularis]